MCLSVGLVIMINIEFVELSPTEACANNNKKKVELYYEVPGRGIGNYVYVPTRGYSRGTIIFIYMGPTSDESGLTYNEALR